MLQPSRITTRPVTFDFSSSGLGSHHDAQLLVDGLALANAIDLVDWTGDPIQVEVCEHCGTTHCVTGGWVAIRSCGSQALFIPAFASMAEEFSEYRPPHLILQHGFVAFSQLTYDALRSVVSELPALNALRPLSCREAALLLQAVAPGQVLGSFPSPPHLDASQVIAADPGGVPEQAEALNKLLSVFGTSPAHAVLQPPSSVVVTLFLDLPGITEWQPFGGTEGSSLLLAPALGVGAA